jgi:hypothetical protein
MPRFTLSKSIWYAKSPGGHPVDHPTEYEVQGMPFGKGAHITMSEHASDRWQIIRSECGVFGKRYGDFESSGEALASLQADV